MQIYPEGVFLNSIPKAGTVLLNNIFMQFISPEMKIVSPWLSAATIGHDAFRDVRGKVFIGHLPFSNAAWAKLKNCKQILLVRNPKDVCLAYARFYASEEMSGRSNLTEFIRRQQPSLSAVLRFMLAGWQIDGERHPPVIVSWREIARWAYLPNVKTVTYEELIFRLRHIESFESEVFFQAILEHGGIDVGEFPDWRARVASGAEAERSPTFRGNLVSLVPTEGFPSAQDLAILDLDYHDLSIMYEHAFLRRDLE